MILVRTEDVFHKAQLLKLLTGIADSPQLSSNLHFKGGTCASMLGYLDRFSVDLDFDLKAGADSVKLRKEFRKLFDNLDLQVEGKNDKTLLFILKYKAPKNRRNKLKLSVFGHFVKANEYKVVYLPEIDRLLSCQTIETMFANKLVAPIDRFKKHGKIAGRDIYDIHYFFSRGYGFRGEIIEERAGKSTANYLHDLVEFIDKKVTDSILSEDLNMLLPYGIFKKVRKTLKSETLIYLRSVISELATGVISELATGVISELATGMVK